MRVIFAGTPQVAVPSLDAIVAAGHDVALVITREDAPTGKKRVLTESPVALRAHELGLPVLKSNALTSEHVAQISALQANIGIIVAFGSILNRSSLDSTEHGWLNIHFSLLPRWRGAAPVQHALIAGDDSTGITIFRLDEGMDTGDIAAKQTFKIAEGLTADALLVELSMEAPTLLVTVLKDLESGALSFQKQTGTVTLAPKLRREDGHLDFAQPAHDVLNRFRGVTAEPGAFAVVDDQPLKLLALEAAPGDADDQALLRPGEVRLVNGHVTTGTGQGALVLRTVQPAGKKPMDARSWLNGRHGGTTLS